MNGMEIWILQNLVDFTICVLVSSFLTSTKVQGDVSCDFEKGLCGWKQDKNDKFDWTENRDSTDTWWTGPNADHTSGDGYYIYIEASSTHNEDTARITSPHLETGQHCFTFWYSMYGRDVNALNVYMKINNNLGTPILSRENNIGSRDWRQAHVNINVSAGYQFVIEGVTGNGDRGDIAVDDILLNSGWCTSDCNFDDGLCAWTQNGNDDDFDWKEGQNYAGSYYTGPEADHTSKHGYYIYIEASYKHNEDTARITSPQLEPGQHCFTFWYSMYGRDVNALNVYMKINDNLGTPILSRENNIGSRDWRQAHININVSTGYQIVIEGVAGDGYMGDIAIDDIEIGTDLCANDTMDCDFETGLCGWKQDQDDMYDWTEHTGYTPSQNTGPEGDHTSGGGYYIYIETSNTDDKDAARISSPLQTPGQHCFTFWYSMYGQDVNALNIYKKINDDLGTPILSLEHNTGSRDWRQAHIYIKSSTDYQIVIEGVAGHGPKGDIAIDDIEMDSSLCLADTVTTEATTTLSAPPISSTLTIPAITSTTATTLPSGSPNTAERTTRDSGITPDRQTGHETEGGSLTAVYISVPVVVIIVVAVVVIIYLRMRQNHTKDVPNVEYEQQQHAATIMNNPSYTCHVVNKQRVGGDLNVGLSGDADAEYININDAYLQCDQTVADNEYNYIDQLKVNNGYDHMKTQYTLSADDTYSHVAINPNEVTSATADMTYSHIGNVATNNLVNQPSIGTDDTYNKLQNIAQSRSAHEAKRSVDTEDDTDPEYDHAIAGCNATSENVADEYSHMNHGAQKPRSHDHNNKKMGDNAMVANNNIYGNVLTNVTVTDVLPNNHGHAVDRKPGALHPDEENQDACESDRHYFILETDIERHEDSTDETGPYNHDYFVLEK